MPRLAERDSVTVILDYSDTVRALRPFYCQKCGRCVCEVFGDVTMLIAGSPEDEQVQEADVRTAYQCRGYWYDKYNNKAPCDAKYIF
jgi:hypothetical protein